MKIVNGILDGEFATIVFKNVGPYSKRKIKEFANADADVFFTSEAEVCERNGVDLTNAEVIFQDDATVLIVDGKKYISKPEKGEKYDAEKGLLVCLMKCAGLTTSDFLGLMKNAKVNKKTVKCDKKKLKKRVK